MIDEKGKIMKYTVRPVVCDYGVFENGELKLICNSCRNAMLISAIMEIDIKGGFDCVFTLNGRAVEIEAPREPCLSCSRADWIDMHGTWCYCCNMGHCIADEEEY